MKNIEDHVFSDNDVTFSNDCSSGDIALFTDSDESHQIFFNKDDVITMYNYLKSTSESSKGNSMQEFNVTVKTVPGSEDVDAVAFVENGEVKRVTIGCELIVTPQLIDYITPQLPADCRDDKFFRMITFTKKNMTINSDGVSSVERVDGGVITITNGSISIDGFNFILGSDGKTKQELIVDYLASIVNYASETFKV